MRVHLSAAAIAFAVAACSPPAPAPIDTAALGKALLARDSIWAATAFAGKNIDSIVSYWSDDAIVVPPGQPSYVGKAAIRAYIESAMKLPGFSINWKSQNPVFSPDGKTAYMTGVQTVTMKGGDGKTMTFAARGVSFWRLDADGQWRCTVDIWNDGPPIGASAAPAK
jgi:ketosteroid isomerase-like protein